MSRFFLSAARIRRHNPCTAGLRQWTDRYGERQVPVTQEVVDYIERCGQVAWVVLRMKLSTSQQLRLRVAKDRYLNAPVGSMREADAMRALQALRKQLILEGPGGDA